MKRTISAFPVYLLLMLLAACTSSDSLEVKRANFTDQIDQLQNLEFQFNKELVPDSLVEIWDSTAYLEFEPSVKGRYKWLDNRTLLFSPSEPFTPNTDYKASITDKVLVNTAEKFSLSNEPIQFHTPYLQFVNGYAYWNFSEYFDKQLQLNVKLVFNYPLDKKQVAEALIIKVNNIDKPYNIISNGISNEVEVVIAVQETDDVKSLDVALSQGMKVIGSAQGLKEALTFQIEVPANDKLDVTDIVTDFEEGSGVIIIYTSQPVVMKELKSKIKIEPQTDFEILPISNGFKLKGSFGESQAYQLTILKDLKGVFGPTLNDDHSQTITFGSPEPFISFADKSGMYLTSGGSGNLGLKIINVPKIKVTVFRIFENNIQHYMRSGKGYEWYEEDGYHDSYNYRMNEDYGKIIVTKEYTTNSLPVKGNLRLLNIKPEDLGFSEDMKGIYLIRAESTEKAWLNDVQLLSYSDIGLIVKKGENEVFAATRSIATALPLEGVTLGFYTSNNQLVHKVLTGRDGVAVFKDLEKTIPGFYISMVTARKGEDFNVILFNKSSVELDRFETGGKHTAGRDYDAFIYADRDLYRPGDSVYCNAILRDYNMKTLTVFPVKFKIIGPDGKDFLKRRVNVSSTGSAFLAFALPDAAYTGTYICEVSSVDDVFIGSYRIKVEEFMPDRISVDVKTDKVVYEPENIVKLTVTAMNLFGPPAVGRKVENELRVSRKKFQPKAFVKDYNFDLISGENLAIVSVINQTVTNDKGIATQEFTLPNYKNAGLLEGKIYSTVFDETGRPVNRLVDFDIYTQKTFLGISKLPGWLSTGKPVSCRLIALNEKEKPVSATARFEVVHTTWETILERNYGQTRYHSQKKDRVLLSKEINIGTEGRTETYIPQQSGEYKFRLSIPGSTFWIEENFYAYSWGNSDETTFRINKDGEIDITFDKQLYEPGQEANILFKTPFAGELLVTVEQNKVIEYYNLKADNNGATLKLPVKDGFIPNVYITGTLIRKVEEGGIPLTVAHGFASMKVEKASYRLPVMISASDQVRSATRQKIIVKTTPGAEVTIAVVDQGILQITDYKTPDPYYYFYQKRALEVNSYDLFDELLAELSTNKTLTGGDQAFDLGKRLNPMTAKRVKLLSLWSDRLTANEKGEVIFTAEIPKFSGAVRIMAVVHKDHRFGSADKLMRVADPVTISSSVPRFMSPGDKAMIQVTLSNTTSRQISLSTSVATSKIFTAGKPEKTDINIPPNSEASVTYSLTALNNMGVGRVTFKAKTADELFTEETELSIRPAVPLVKEASAGVIQAGKSANLSVSSEMVKGTSSSRLMLTNNPAGIYANHLEELINYPYGCLEQTISAAFPQLYLSDIAKLLKKETLTGSSNINLNISEAIRKISFYQQYNGGLVTWPGHGTINWWISAYAAHFMYEAERAGYNVEKQTTDNLHKYLLEKVKQKGSTEYFYWHRDEKRWIKRDEANREIFYSLYVLALNGKHHLPTMNYYKVRLNELTHDSKYLLACTYLVAGDEKSYNQVLPKEWNNDNPAQMTGESFSSPIRDKGLALYTLVSVDENNPQIALLARQIGEMINNERWMNTQERVFSLLALGKMARNNSMGSVSARIEYNGNTANYQDETLLIKLLSGKATITTSGKGNLYWYLEAEGIPANMKVKEEDRILKVRRQYFSRAGQPLAANTVKQNDLLVVALTVSTTDNSIIENVVITDLLPACFELENARLTAEREMDWIKMRATPDYLDVRDDRINIFTTAAFQPKTFYYMVRVVNTGTYTQGPVGAEAMYNAQYYSYSGLKTITAQ
jgi:alpha-2-macroglobulin